VRRAQASLRLAPPASTTALTAMEEQRRARAGPASERNEAAGTSPCRWERATVAARGRQIETETSWAPTPDSERAIRWLIALMVLCCDPLAPTAAASARVRPNESNHARVSAYRATASSRREARLTMNAARDGDRQCWPSHNRKQSCLVSCPDNHNPPGRG
jgi:hypothetical protein